jgi:amino acid transporter
VVPVVFQSVANMAPAAAVAFSLLFAAPYAGGSTPLAIVAGLVACLLVAVTIGQLAKHLPSAGGLYTYNARGLGSSAGFLVGWAFVLAEVVVAPGGLLILGSVVSSALNTDLGWPAWTWAPAVVLAGLLIWFLVHRGIRLATAASVVLGLFEIIVFAALAVTLIVHAGPRNTGAVFTPHFHNVHGIGSIVPGVLYAVFGIIGFEAAAPLGEEARNPERTIPRAVVLSCAAIGGFYLLCYYGLTTYFGPAKMAGLVNFGAGDPWGAIAKQVWGLGFIAVIIALVNSSIAGSNASSVATTRVGYALGRIGLLPKAITHINHKTGTPTIAVAVQAVFAIGFALGIGFGLGGPLKALLLQGTISTVLIVVIYILTCVSCVSYYWRERRGEFNVLLHLIIPVLGALIFIPVLLAGLGIDFGGLGIQPLAFPATIAPWLIYAWVGLGLVVLGYFLARDKRRLSRTGLLFEAEPGEELAGTGPGTRSTGKED